MRRGLIGINQQMHRTEGIGVAYDFVEMQGVQHQFAAPRGRYGYAACFGVLDCGGGLSPVGLAAIPVSGRVPPSTSRRLPP